MKILYFHQHFSTPKGSAGIRSYQMARSLIAFGHQVTIVCGSYNGGQTGLESVFSNGRRRGIVDGIEIIEFDLSYSNEDNFLKRATTFFVFAARSVRIALTESYDILFSTTTPLTAGIPGIFGRWLRRKPFVFEVRDLWPELPRAMGVIRNRLLLSAMRILEWTSYHSAHRLIGLSPGIAKGIERLGIDNSKIAMIPNGCDLDIFSEADQPWRPMGVDSSDLMAVFAGTHGLANGLDAVLDAAAELIRRGRRDIKIVLIGQGKLKPALQARAHSEGLVNIIFHDPVNKAKLSGLMASSDIGLQVLSNVPEFYDGTSPNKFFDYIAAGLPVLNNYPGWLAELIREHRFGFAVSPDNPGAFADALEQAADDRSMLKEMGLRSRHVAHSLFSRSTLASQWVNWVTSVKP